MIAPDNEGAKQIRIYASLPEGRLIFNGYPNAMGFLGKIVLESITASGFDDAELKAYRALAPTLSNCSIHRDVPMHIYQTDSAEIATGNSRTSLVNPYLNVTSRVKVT